MGTMATITIPVEDGTSLPAYLARPAANPAPAGVIVAHELFGVNPDIRGVADDLARAGSWPSRRSSTTGTPHQAAGWSAMTPGGRRASATCSGCDATRQWPTSRRPSGG
jgi:hypothetical protein